MKNVQISLIAVPTEIPDCSSIPKGIDNALVAGSPIATDHPVQASIKVMLPSLSTGQVAELTATSAFFKNRNMHAITTSKLRDNLRKD